MSKTKNSRRRSRATARRAGTHHPLNPGTKKPSFVLKNYEIITLWLHGKRALILGKVVDERIWEFESTLVVRLEIAIDGVDHTVGFFSILGIDDDMPLYEAGDLKIVPGSELHAWLGEQVARIWSEVPN